MDDTEIKEMRCPDCGKVRKLSVFKGESIRNTFCRNCMYSVIWVENNKEL